RAAAGVRGVECASFVGLRRPAAVLAPRLRGARFGRRVRRRRCARRGARARASRARPNGRGLRPGGGAERDESMVDPDGGLRSRADWLGEGRRLDVPITPLNTPEDFVAEEQTRTRGYFRRTGFPRLGDAPFAPSPFNFSRTPAVLARPAPAPGQDDGDFAPRA